MSLSVLTSIQDRGHFHSLLQQNPGGIIIKFGAEWCGPCKQIEKQVKEYMDRLPSNIQPFIIDVDESFDVYAYLKTKKMINGIPAILFYKKGNETYIPDDVVVGANPREVLLFFQRCVVAVGK